MAQFTRYTSAEVGAPALSGSSGSLLVLLDACLVNGFGSRTGVGWTKPWENTGSYGCIQQGTGSFCSMFIKDDAPGAGGTKEARVTGWESISNMTLGLATGSGQFPTVVQLAIGQGAVVVRKSATIDSTLRSWNVFADSRSVYLFIEADTAGVWKGYAFGDIYSVKTGSLDQYKCMIAGKIVENTATATGDRLDALSAINAATTGHFIARSYSGASGSVLIGKHGDATKGSATVLLGGVIYPNSADNGMYISPVWVHESATSMVRGRMRGLYQVCHTLASFPTNGVMFTGSADYGGKNFILLRQSGNSGMYLLETSDTLETN